MGNLPLRYRVIEARFHESPVNHVADVEVVHRQEPRQCIASCLPAVKNFTPDIITDVNNYDTHLFYKIPREHMITQLSIFQLLLYRLIARCGHFPPSPIQLPLKLCTRTTQHHIDLEACCHLSHGRQEPYEQLRGHLLLWYEYPIQTMCGLMLTVSGVQGFRAR